MGAQIGCEYALRGYPVTLVARNAERLRDRVEAAFELVRAHGLESAGSVESARRRLSVALPDATVHPSTDLVVESLPEDLDAKRAVLSEIVEALPDAIIASNTSSIPITDLGEAIGAPTRTIGTHYWNPPLLMPPVEVVVGNATAPAVVSEVTRVLTSLGKEPVIVQHDVPGFIWNRLQQAILREALWLVENGVATPEAIDTVVRSGIARRSRYTGPFETIALGGVNTWQQVARNVFPHLSNATDASDLRQWLPASNDDLDATRARRDEALARELADAHRSSHQGQARRRADGD